MRAHFVIRSHDRKRGLITTAAAAIIGGTIGAGLLLGGGITAGISTTKSGQNVAEKKKAALKAEADRTRVREQSELEAIQNAPAEARKRAQDEIARKRSIRQRSGGQTLLTTDTTPLGGAGGRTLLGG